MPKSTFKEGPSFLLQPAAARLGLACTKHMLPNRSLACDEAVIQQGADLGPGPAPSAGMWEQTLSKILCRSCREYLYTRRHLLGSHSHRLSACCRHTRRPGQQSHSSPLQCRYRWQMAHSASSLSSLWKPLGTSVRLERLTPVTTVPLTASL